MNDYDIAARYAARTDPAGFLRWLLGPDARVAFREWIDTRTLPAPGGRDRTSDLLAGLDALDPGASPSALLIEFQTRRRDRTGERGLEYVGMLAREFRSRLAEMSVLPAVVMLTGTADGIRVRMELPGVAGAFVESSPVSRALRDENASGTLTRIAAGTLPRSILGWVPLMGDASDPAVIARWLELAAPEPDGRRRADLALLARTFARLTPAVAAWHHALEDWPMEDTVPWMEELRVESTLRTQRSTLLMQLNERFGTLPGPVISAVDACDDAARLREWLRAVVRSTTLADWRRTADV